MSKRRDDDDDDAHSLFGAPPAAASAPQESMFDTMYASLFPTAAAPRPAPLAPANVQSRIDESPFDLFPTKPNDRQQDLDELEELFPTKREVPRDAPSTVQKSRPLSEGRKADLFPPTPPTANDEFKKGGNAMDIIFVRDVTGTSVGCTAWHVSFNVGFLQTVTGDLVDVFVNGQQLPSPMTLNDKGRCSEMPDELTLAAISSILPMDHPPLYASVRFEHRKPSAAVRFVECRMYVWRPDDAVVVVDLDGTITISDVEGHIRTIRLGQYDYIHAGVCAFYSRLLGMGLRILYLTARPIDWTNASRDHLDRARQGNVRLPPGPLLTNSMGVTGALMTEVVHKNPHVFKRTVMNAVQMACIAGGRISPHPVFVAGFGNRPTDVQAYLDVGIDGSCIFLIDPTSNLRPSIDNSTVYQSYSDPRAMLWLLQHLQTVVPIDMTEVLDAQVAETIVAVDDFLQFGLKNC
ncbi:hypothetical protein AeRB84_001490 [Aphanomyces euteiches]|nr:hypothetical protein AeRB84_001490 [Aphanomyces euteiches]